MDLYIFDFDDTLAITDSMIKLVRDGEETFLTSHEFAAYRPKPGDELDFTDFNRVGGSLIEATANEMEKAINDVGRNNVFIVTARSIAPPVVEWLSSRVATVPEVIATEGSEGKAPWLMDKLNSEEFESVIVYEDCQKNIRMLKNTVEEFNKNNDSNVLYSAMCILPDQRMVQVETRWKDENVISETDWREITRNFVRSLWK